MGASVDFYLYAKNKNTDKFEDISWRSADGAIPMFTGYSSYVGMVKEYFKSITEYVEGTFDFLTKEDNATVYYIKRLHDIKYLKPAQKIMYIHYDFIDMLNGSDEIFETDLDCIYTYNDEEKYNFPFVIDPKLYGQLIQEEKQKYIPFILKADDRDDIYAMNIVEICKKWLSEFEWTHSNYKKYDFDNILIVARIFW